MKYDSIYQGKTKTINNLGLNLNENYTRKL